MVDVNNSDDPEGLQTFYYLVQDLKVRVINHIIKLTLSGGLLKGRDRRSKKNPRLTSVPRHVPTQIFVYSLISLHFKIKPVRSPAPLFDSRRAVGVEPVGDEGRNPRRRQGRGLTILRFDLSTDILRLTRRRCAPHVAFGTRVTRAEVATVGDELVGNASRIFDTPSFLPLSLSLSLGFLSSSFPSSMARLRLHLIPRCD